MEAASYKKCINSSKSKCIALSEDADITKLGYPWVSRVWLAVQGIAKQFSTIARLYDGLPVVEYVKLMSI